MFLEDKDLMDTISFECLIQQNPIERLGLLFDEKEMAKFEEYSDEENFVRNVAAVDVAWGGGDYLSMPIVSEYKNGDCPLIDVYISQEAKEVTIPEVVNKIIEHHITAVHFEANNGGDMYAEKVEEELKKKGVKWCNITSGKVPTTKSKLDRILASAGAIKGSKASDYRLLIKKRTAIKNNYMYNEFLDLLFKFSQSLKVQGKQKDDTCFEGETLIATQFGNKKIKDIKVGDKIITPFGLDKVEYVGCTGIKETITKLGLNATKNHKVFNGIDFECLDTLTKIPKNGIMTLKEMLKWKYKKQLCLTELNIDLWGREGIILANKKEIKTGKILKDFMLRFGNFIIKKKYLKATTFIIKMVIHLIMTFLIWSVYHLGNTYQKMEKRIGTIQNIEKKHLKICKKQQRKLKNGINQKQEGNGTKNMLNIQYLMLKNTNTNVLNVGKHITAQELQKPNIAQKNVELNIEQKSKSKKTKVYNLKCKKYGCYYANGILVSNCDSLANLFQNVLGCKSDVGRVHSHFSREDLGI